MRRARRHLHAPFASHLRRRRALGPSSRRGGGQRAVVQPRRASATSAVASAVAPCDAGGSPTNTTSRVGASTVTPMGRTEKRA